MRIKQWIIDELESCMLLYYTGTARESAHIIDEQTKNTSGGNAVAIEAMHQIKQSAIEIERSDFKRRYQVLCGHIGQGHG